MLSSHGPVDRRAASIAIYSTAVWEMKCGFVQFHAASEHLAGCLLQTDAALAFSLLRLSHSCVVCFLVDAIIRILGS